MILDKPLQLKTAVLDSNKNCKVVLSQPMTRADDGKACLNISKPNDILEELNIPIVKNRNVTVDHLGIKGIAYIESIWNSYICNEFEGINKEIMNKVW